MVETKPAADVPESDSLGASGILAAASGLLTVGIGVTVAGSYPVLASVLVGLPVGFAIWAGVRELAQRTVGWPLADAEPAPVENAECTVPDDDCQPG